MKDKQERKTATFSRILKLKTNLKILGICTKRNMVKRAALSQPEIKQSCFCWKACVWSAPGEKSKRKCEKLLITLG